MMVLLWFSYIYHEELLEKMNFVKQFNAVKQYQKLTQLKQILMQKNTSMTAGSKSLIETHNDVTILHCEIENFD
jgi:hypothetical protein